MGLEKASGRKKLLKTELGGGQQRSILLQGYDVTIMDFSTSQLQKDADGLLKKLAI